MRHASQIVASLPTSNPLTNLTPSKTNIVHALIAGHTTPDAIATLLGITSAAATWRLCAIRNKLQCHSAADVVRRVAPYIQRCEQCNALLSFGRQIFCEGCDCVVSQ